MFIGAALEMFSFAVLVLVYHYIVNSYKRPRNTQSITIAMTYFIFISLLGPYSGGCMSIVTLIGPAMI